MNLFDSLNDIARQPEQLAPGAVVLYNFATTEETTLLDDIRDVVARAPFRNMITPGGYRMSVAMTNCGPLGWVSDKSGYRYISNDPVSGLAWPSMPASFLRLATSAA